MQISPVQGKAESRSAQFKPLLVLLALGVVLWVCTCGLWDVRGPDEGRYTQVARELLQRHNWLVLTVQGHPYDQKPPLAFWFFALALKIAGGVNTWALRMPGVLAALGTIALTYGIALQRWGTRAAFFAGLFLLAAPAFIDDAPAVELNMLYAFFTIAALAVWLQFEFVNPDSRLPWARAALFWLCVAAAFFCERPPRNPDHYFGHRLCVLGAKIRHAF